MLLSYLLTAWASIGLLSSAEAGKSSKASDAVLASKVKTITLSKEKQAAHRRVPAIPQLRCIGGNAQRYYEVDMMRCTNIGTDYDGLDLQWTCKAELPPEFRLGSTEVLCEGYERPDDPYILKNSCGVEYRLVLTPLGEARYGSEIEGFWGILITWAVILFIVGVFAYGVYSNCVHGMRGPNPVDGFHWGGGNGGGGDDPPPPYSPRGSGKSTSAQGAGNAHSGPQAQQQANGWGFWRGAAAGALGGWTVGRFANQGQYHDPYYRSRWNQPHGHGWNQPSMWHEQPPAFPSRASSTTHESSGFGGTTRR